ncbi:GlyGly-CTERM sorting domain-containing protein, partial [Aeromonas allosaccharophila]|uniref:GlyGly-CTERM sorting domain-containing protein n=1 Tax=Aeromonas allosaccharophila TaxID=656 RepID=UPI0030066C81
WIPCLLSRGMAMAQRRCSTIGISYLESLNGTTYHFSLERDDSASVDSHRSDDNSGGGAVDVLAMFFLGILGLRRMH